MRDATGPTLVTVVSMDQERPQRMSSLDVFARLAFRSGSAMSLLLATDPPSVLIRGQGQNPWRSCAVEGYL
jgi:hypothetical protein